MNERIKALKYDAVISAATELEGEVGDIFDFENPAHRLFINRMDLAYNKFAVLIVLECAKIARVYSEEGVEFGGGDAIKEHFGVD